MQLGATIPDGRGTANQTTSGATTLVAAGMGQAKGKGKEETRAGKIGRPKMFPQARRKCP